MKKIKRLSNKDISNTLLQYNRRLSFLNEQFTTSEINAFSIQDKALYQFVFSVRSLYSEYIVTRINELIKFWRNTDKRTQKLPEKEIKALSIKAFNENESKHLDFFLKCLQKGYPSLTYHDFNKILHVNIH